MSEDMKKLIKFRWLFIVLLELPISIYAQVSVAPTSVFITDATGIESLYIRNSSETAQEVSILFQFAYPGSDKEGNLVMIRDSTQKAALYDIGSQTRVFPRTFILQPGNQQVVRLQVRPLTGKPDGMYWTRIIVTTKAAVKDVEAVPATEGVGARINYVLSQNIPVFYSKGKVATGLVIGDVTTSLEKGKLIAVSKLTPTGNAPFSGSVTARLLNSTGKEVAIQQQTLVAYFEVLRRVELSLPSDGLPPGRYTLEFTYETKRTDIPQDKLVQAKPVKNVVPVEIK
jgi:hypothetical protein